MKAIILAGGSGSRLWPLSRDMYPKQLLNLTGDLSLLQQTFLRVSKSIKASDILTITNIKHYEDIKLQLNKIDKSNIILAEPLGKNTAPAIACALEFFKQTASDDIVIILPSDHLIKDISSFEQTINQATALALNGYIVTFGIKPSYAETGYGYIKIKDSLLSGYKVERFVEKPDLQTAQLYLKSSEYFWNSGIFMGKISTLMQEFQNFAPQIYSCIQKLDFKSKANIAYNIYENMPSISIDYAIMEKSSKIALVELKSDWNDLGSWQSLYEVKDKDENQNVLINSVIVNNVKNSFIYSQKNLVAVSDLEDIILVETEDAIMACKKSNSQNVKILYERLKAKQSDTTKLHKTIFRPWGYYTCLNQAQGYLVKILCVMPQQKLSYQSHNYRSEHWTILQGKALVILDGKEYYISSGQSIDIPLKAKHSLQNPYDEELKIIEVQKGDFISEDDIIRYEDYYGRI